MWRNDKQNEEEAAQQVAAGILNRSRGFAHPGRLVVPVCFLIIVLCWKTVGETPPPFLWARSGNGSSDEEALGITVDPAGNVIVTGYFSGSETIGASNFVSSGSEDIFLAKYDPAGNLLWARQAGGSGIDEGHGVGTDSSGNIYVAGLFQNTANFGTTNLVSNGSNDVFVAKYSSAGSLLWARRAGGSGNEAAFGLAVDPNGNSYITGTFDNTASFGSWSLANNSKSDDIFIVKCDTDGNFLWAQKAGGNLDDAGKSVSVDGTGNVYVTGYFAGSATFGTTNLSGAGTNSMPDIFLAKYDSAGNFLWVRQAGGSGDDRGNSVATDRSGNVSVTGQFIGTAAFNASTSLTANGNGPDIFVTRFDTGGNLLWARRAGGNNAIYGDIGNGVASDNSSNTFVTGYFSGTAGFGSTSVTSIGFQDVFCCKYDSAGNVAWVRNAGGAVGGVPGNDFGFAVGSDNQSNVVVAGFFLSSTITFGSVTLTNSGGRDFFVAKVGQPPVTIAPTLSATSSNSQIVLSWPTAAAGFVLESELDLSSSNWTAVSGMTNVSGGSYVISLPMSAPQQYFRLHKQ